jgi:hypothetical protein
MVIYIGSFVYWSILLVTSCQPPITCNLAAFPATYTQFIAERLLHACSYDVCESGNTMAIMWRVSVSICLCLYDGYAKY